MTDHLRALSDFEEGTDTLTLSPETRQRLTRLRGYIRVALEDTNALVDLIPEVDRDTIGHALLTAQGEISGLLGDGEDGA